MNETERTIDSFGGSYNFLSNFYPSIVTLDEDKTLFGESFNYPTVEHAFQAAKALDKTNRLFVLGSRSPGEAKKRGGKVNPLRDGWDQYRLQVMEELLKKKFQDKVLAQKLLDTGNAKLVEGNTWGDRYWGVCRGQGQNHLGILLMKIRDEIRLLN